MNFSHGSRAIFTALRRAFGAAPGTLDGAEKLEEVDGWDSVALVSFLAMVDEHFGRRLAPRDVGKCETVDELYRLASA